MSGLTYPKPKDLSHLVDSRIGVPEADVSERITETDFSVNTFWENAGTIASTGVLTFTSTGVGGQRLKPGASALVSGKTYLCHVVGVSDGDMQIRNYAGTSTYIDIGNATFDEYFVFTADTDNAFYIRNQITGTTTFTTLSVVEWNGEELVPDADVGFVANKVSTWTTYLNNTTEQDGNAVKITYVDSSNGAVNDLSSPTDLWNDASSGKYQFAFRAKISQGSANIAIFDGSTYNNVITLTNTEYQTFVVQQQQLTSRPYIRLSSLSSGETVWIEVLSVMKITGLVAAYNMIPSGDTLVDISGEGNNGTIYDCASDKDGLRFRGIEFTRVTFSQISLGQEYTVAFRIKPEDLNTFPILGNISSSTNFIVVTGGTALQCRCSSGGSSTASISYRAGDWLDIVVTRYGTAAIKPYFNGVLLTSTDMGADADFLIREIGRISSASYARGVIADLQIYNYAFSEAEAIAYHNQFAQRINQRHAFDDLDVGSSI